jgi:hypothetical protein
LKPFTATAKYLLRDVAGNTFEYADGSVIRFNHDEVCEMDRGADWRELIAKRTGEYPPAPKPSKATRGRPRKKKDG